MPQLCIFIKSFEWCYIENTILFIKKIELLLNKKNINEIYSSVGCESSHDKSYSNQSVISLPKKSKLFTVLRSPHVHKKSREQFEFTYYKKKFFIKIENINYAVLLIFLLKNSEFPGVEMEISFHYNSFFNTHKFL